ncbi:MAG TPA: hypothetical protein VJM77_08540 [Nitrospiria bacterium]|nr:hypothetical protein [Nitrospiria bacterium]
MRMIFLLLTAFFLLFSLIAGDAEARPLNLRGSIDLNYGWTTLETTTAQTTTRSFLHRYSLGSFGDLWDPRLGTYDADVSYQGDTGKTDGVKNRDSDTLDYRLGISLLPRKSPLTLFAQRITRENDLPPSTSRNTLDTYSLAWDLPLRRLPALRFNLFQTDSRTIPSTIGTTRTRAASVDASQRFVDTSIFTRYQYSEQKSGISPTTTAHNVNLNGETRLSPTTILNVRGNYSNRSATLGVVNPQLSTFQQRSAGALLIHQPSLTLNNRASYDYFRDPFERHIFQGNSNYRATEKLTLSGSYRYFRFTLPAALTQSHFATFGTQYRPLLGVSTGLNLSYSLTDVNAVTDAQVFSQNYNYFINYFKTLERIILNTGYSGNYIRTSTDPGIRSTDVINTLTLGVNNASPRYVSLGSSYSYSNIYRNQSPGEDHSRDQHSLNLTAQSSYLRDLLLRGDLLSLSGSANYTLFDIDSGTEASVRTDETIIYDTLRGIILSSGHNYENVGTEISERNVVFSQVQVVAFLMRNLHLTASARETFQLYTKTDDITLFEGRSNLLYQLGRITISLEYTFTQQDQETSEFKSQSFFVRASRPLF